MRISIPAVEISAYQKKSFKEEKCKDGSFNGNRDYPKSR